MRDAHLIRGKEIEYQGKTWIINEFLYVPSNPEVYVELYDGRVRMNVKLGDIKKIITT
jgi:hypothetical protein